MHSSRWLNGSAGLWIEQTDGGKLHLPPAVKNSASSIDESLFERTANAL